MVLKVRAEGELRGGAGGEPGGGGAIWAEHAARLSGYQFTYLVAPHARLFSTDVAVDMACTQLQTQADLCMSSENF